MYDCVYVRGRFMRSVEVATTNNSFNSAINTSTCDLLELLCAQEEFAVLRETLRLYKQELGLSELVSNN